MVYTKNGDRQVELARLGIGQMFGELALIFDAPRMASVKSLEETNLIMITRDVLKRKLERSDPTVKAIVEMLTKRIISANNAAFNKDSSIEDVVMTTRMMYENILSGLSDSQKRTFQNGVLPNLEALLDSIEAFKGRLNQ